MFALCKGFICLIDKAHSKKAEPFTTKYFPTKLYQPEEDPTKGQISDKDVECFLCLVASIINFEKENTCARVSFKIRLPASGLQLY